jgi:hypothetical protein
LQNLGDNQIIDWRVDVRGVGARTPRARVKNRVATPREFWVDPLKEAFYFPERYIQVTVTLNPMPNGYRRVGELVWGSLRIGASSVGADPRKIQCTGDQRAHPTPDR